MFGAWGVLGDAAASGTRGFEKQDMSPRPEASQLEWSHLRCRTEGTLDRVERMTRFVGHGRIPAGGPTKDEVRHQNCR